MVNQTSALSPPGRVSVFSYPCIELCTPSFFSQFKYCLSLTNPLLLFKSKGELARARCIVAKYRKNLPLPACLTYKDLYDAHLLYDSAFHPTSGNKINILGRKCAQIPLTALILGGLLTYYCNTKSVIIGHLVNQSYFTFFNSVRANDVNPVTIGTSLIIGNATAIGTALYLNKLTRCSRPIIRRFVPAAAVCAGTIMALPMLRIREFSDGTAVFDDKNRYLGKSRVVSTQVIFLSIIKHLLTVLPGMALSPFIIQDLYMRGFFCRYPWSILPVNIGIMASTLLFTVPFTCALLPRCRFKPLNSMELEIKRQAKVLAPGLKNVLYQESY